MILCEFPALKLVVFSAVAAMVVPDQIDCVSFLRCFDRLTSRSGTFGMRMPYVLEAKGNTS